MAYRLKRSDGSIRSAVRRIAREQAEAAFAELADAQCDAAETVHRVRKRCKQLRGVVRLVRPVFPRYAEVNARLRELAAPLSVIRDADVMIATYDRVMEAEDNADRKAMGAIRQRLTLNRKALAAVINLDARLEAFRQGLDALRDDITSWDLDRDGFDAIASGLGKTYRRARKAMANAAAQGRAEDFHDWRKGVKYHWYHARLLSPLWPAEMAARTEEAKALGELLGEHHDIAVLHHNVSSRPRDFGKPEIVDMFLEALDRRRVEAERHALADGMLLLSEPAGALVERWRGYWHAWRERNDAPHETESA